LDEYREKRESFTITNLEKEYNTEFRLDNNFESKNIRLTGIFDRIDAVGNNICIIDYKTGKVNKSDLKLKAWEDLLSDSGLDKCFQLLFYTYIYRISNLPKSESVTAGILSLRNLKDGILFLELPEDSRISNDSMLKFEAVLIQLFNDILDPEKSFEQTDNEDDCKYCPFKSICNRN
jgi:ATP-dependent helicase/DNAse subunit B